MAKKAEVICAQARLFAEKWREYWQFNINQYHEMQDFVFGRQWTEDEEDMLTTYKKVPLQFNKLATMVNSLIGEQQQNTPRLQVVPMENCDEETANIRELIVKELTFSSGAKNTYQIAAAQAFVGGFSAFCVDTDYNSPKSFDLDIIYRSLKDPTLAYFDVSAERTNKTDGMAAGYVSRMSRAKFRAIYGKHIEEKITSNTQIAASKEEIALVTQPGINGNQFSWADDDAITIQDHFVRSYVNDTLYKLSNGHILNQEEMQGLIEYSQKMREQIRQEQQQQLLMQLQGMIGQDEQPQDIKGMQLPQEITADVETAPEGEEVIALYDDGMPVRLEGKRVIKKYKVMHYKIAGDYILDEADFPSEQLPIIFVDQQSYYDKNGKQICRSFLQDAIDAQRYINYLGTQSAYMLKVSRYDQWIGSKKNVASLDTQQQWRDPLSIQGMLTYDESPSGDRPQQVQPPELSQSLLTQYQRAIDDLYTSTGLYPTRMGQQGNEVSGAAIDARTRQGSYSTYNAFNSINRAIAVGGEIVNEMIPRVYDAERVIALQSPDEGMKTITVNKQLDAYGEKIENDIRKGTYEVRLMPGPSFEGQKEQALQSLQTVLQANPQLFGMIADLYVDNLPLANTIELKNRLKTLVPPNIIEAGKTGKSPPQNQEPNPEQQALMMQQQQQAAQIQLKQQELQIKQQELALKTQQIQMDAQTKLHELETERLEVAAQLEEQKLRYLAETNRTQTDHAMAHADNITKILTHKI